MGYGNPLREFLHVDDLASAIFLIEKDPNETLINVGSGDEISIKNLSIKIKEILEFDGELKFDTSMDGIQETS